MPTCLNVTTTTNLLETLWEQESSEEGDCCQAIQTPCSKVACWRVEWSFNCPHNVILYCVEHKDYVASRDSQWGLWHCAKSSCRFKTGLLISITPLKGSTT